VLSCLNARTQTERGGEVFYITYYESMRKEEIRQKGNCEISNTTQAVK
jgi:hypothetical protein